MGTFRETDARTPETRFGDPQKPPSSCYGIKEEKLRKITREDKKFTFFEFSWRALRGRRSLDRDGEGELGGDTLMHIAERFH